MKFILIFFVKLTEQIKSEMGNLSEKLEAFRNSATEDGGQFPKENKLQTKFINSLSEAKVLRLNYETIKYY